MRLLLQDDEQVTLDAAEEPSLGSTVLDLEAAKRVAEKLEEDAANMDQPKKPGSSPGVKKSAAAPASKSSTQSAAEAILAKMSRRNRK